MGTNNRLMRNPGLSMDKLTLANGMPAVILNGEVYYIKLLVKGGFYIESANNREKREWVYIRN